MKQQNTLLSCKRPSLTAALAALILSILLAGCGGPPDASGKWSGTGPANGEQVTINLSLQQNDKGRLSGYGSLSGQNEDGTYQNYPFDIHSGAVGNDGSVDFRGVMQSGSFAAADLDFNGNLSDGTLAGWFDLKTPSAPQNLNTWRMNLRKKD